MAHRSRVRLVLVPLLTALLAALMQPALAAQVPPGSGVRMASALTSPAGGGGVTIVDPVTGTLTPVVGLSANGKEALAGLIDPSNGRIILGLGGIPTVGGILRVELSGAAVDDEALLVDLGGASIIDIALDRDGNYVVLATGLGLLSVSRQTLQVTTIDTNHYPGFMDALAVDPETNRCWVVTGRSSLFVDEDNVLIEYDLDDGPGAGAVLASLASNGYLNSPWGLAFDGQDTLYIGGTCIPFCTAEHLVRYTLSTGTLTNVVPGPTGAMIAGVHVDLVTGDLHIVENSFSGNWLVFDPDAGVVTSVVTFPPVEQYVSALDLNDWIDRTALFPRHISSSASTLVEMAAHGLPGELGFLAVVKLDGAPIAPLILGIGPMDSGGYFTFSATAPPGLLAAGMSFTILSARQDLTTRKFTLGSLAELSVGP